MSFSKLVTITFVLSLGILAPWAGASGAMYKWVDADGNVTYSQRRPPEGQAEVIKPPPKVDSEAARQALQERQSAFAERKTTQETVSTDAKIEQQNAEIKRSNCKIARDNMQKLQTQYMGVKQADGSTRRITPADQKAMEKRFKDQIKANCM